MIELAFYLGGVIASAFRLWHDYGLSRVWLALLWPLLPIAMAIEWIGKFDVSS